MNDLPGTSSVLINNYNNGAFLASCVESVLAQTRPADEVIVYDDGSTDGSLERLRGYGSCLTVIEGRHDPARPSRASQAHAVAEAFWRSKGEWLFLLDGDDRFASRKVEQVLAAVAGRTGVSLVQSPMTLIDHEGREIGRYRDRRFHHPCPRALFYEQHDVDFFYPTSALVVHRAALARVLPLDMRVCPELACDTRIGMAMPLLGEVLTLDDELAQWRRHGGSYIAGLSRSRWFQAQQTLRRIRAFNAMAPAFGAERLVWWRNRRLWRQLAGALMPAGLRRRWRRTGVIFQGEKPAERVAEPAA